MGKKGELFPPKEVRDQAGLHPGDPVVYSAQIGKIEVQKLPTLKQAFQQRKFTRISFKEFEEMTKEVLQ